MTVTDEPVDPAALSEPPGWIFLVLLGLLGAQVIEARDRIGGFSSAEEVIAYTDLAPSLVDGIRERLVFLP